MARLGSRDLTGVLAAAVITAVLTCSLASFAARSQNTAAGAISSVTVAPEVDSVTVGERFHVRHTFVYQDSLKMVIPSEIESGTCRILSLVWSEKRLDDRIQKTASLTLITLDLEEARLPEMVVEFHTPSGDTLLAFGDEVVIPVRQLAATSESPRPLKEQWTAPRSYRKWIIAAAVLIAVVAIFLWWLRRRAHRVVEEPPEPQLPADYVALTELTRIEKLDLLRAGEFKKYYSLVTDTVRRYLHARFGVDAMDRTTVELLDELNSRGRRVEKLGDLLNEADLVKFAKYIPAVEEGESAMSSAREIVVKTTKKTVDPDGEEGASVDAAAAGGSTAGGVGIGGRTS